MMDDIVFICAGAVNVPEGVSNKFFNFKVILLIFSSDYNNYTSLTELNNSSI